MRTTRVPSVLRRLAPWLLGWLGLQAVVAIAGLVTAQRTNLGDETSTSIRRTFTHNGLELRPTNPALSRVRVDLAMAGAEIDLTGVDRPPAGVDLTVRALMAGAAVRVPADWRVWWQFRGVGGIGADERVRRTDDQQAADLRLYATAVFGGIGVEAG